MRHFYAFLCIAGIAAIFGSSSCNVINPAEVVPTYVHIDSFSFKGDPARTGSASHKITSVFAYFNNAPVGVFDLPVTFPVIATAPGTLLVIPGVDFDGLTGYQATYPHYIGHEMPMTPSPGNTIDYTPATEYSTGARLLSNEEFEQGWNNDNSFVRLFGDADLINTTTASEVFEGGGSGLIRLGAGQDSTSVISRTGISIPANKSSFIELNYKGNMSLLVGMQVRLIDGSLFEANIIGLKPRTEWGKIYIGADEFVGAYQGTNYKMIIRTLKPEGLSDGFLYLDNIKVLSF